MSYQDMTAEQLRERLQKNFQLLRAKRYQKRALEDEISSISQANDALLDEIGSRFGKLRAVS